MKRNETKIVQKSSEKFKCELCDYTTCRKSQYERHLSTDKHISRTIETDSKQSKQKSTESSGHQCICGICFNSRTTLWRHKKTCTFEEKPCAEQAPIQQTITPELVMELIKNNKELQQIILEQHTTLNNLVKNGISNTSLNSHNNNSNNKTFNLQFFLNETCKDAMNIMDFVDSIKLQLSDLEKVGEVGYTKGISNIITTNLKALEVTQRPVHCTDKKRETMYIKDEDKWEKEDENNSKLRKAIKRVANKNITLLSKFREKYPDYSNSSSKISDKYDHIVIEAMGGAGDNDTEKEDKIIHNISKCVIIDK